MLDLLDILKKIGLITTSDVPDPEFWVLPDPDPDIFSN